MKKVMNHGAYQKRVKGLTDAELAFSIKDCKEALAAMPEGENAGYYQDEIHYLAAEVKAREESGVNKTTEQMVFETLRPLISKLKKKIYTPEGQLTATDEDCLGMIVSKFCKWDIGKVIEVCKSAMEDSNCHDGVKMLEEFEESALA